MPTRSAQTRFSEGLTVGTGLQRIIVEQTQDDIGVTGVFAIGRDCTAQHLEHEARQVQAATAGLSLERRMNTAAFPAIPLTGANSQAPLAMLYASHRRALGYCATLRRLVRYVAEHGYDRYAQVLSHGLLRFFDNEVPQSYADEEEDLFPALIESMAGSDALCLHDLTRGSAHQHLVLATLWENLRGPLEEIAAGRKALLPAQTVEAFARQWSDHIGLEEGELLAMASRLLTDDELMRVDRCMQERRG